MTIKQIFDEIANESSTKQKQVILAKYKDNELLKKVLHLACSKRVKFYIKQIPEYVKEEFETNMPLEQALITLEAISTRKVTGNDAIAVLQGLLNSMTLDDAYIIERIIGKDCKMGMNTTFINKVIPSLIEKTPYQGCVPFDIKKAKALFEKGKTCISEIKADGRYVNVIIRGGDVEMESRQGEPTVLGECDLLTDLSHIQDCVLNGELIMHNTPRLIANGIISSIIDYNLKFAERTDAENAKKYSAFTKEKGMTIEEATALLKIKVWDILDVEEYFEMKSTTKRLDRLNRLKEVVQNSKNIEIIEHRFVKSYEEAMKHFTDALEAGEEGTVLKSLDGGWKNGKPTYQIKLKLEMHLDLKIIGFNYGNKGTKNENVISSIACESSCGKLTANAQGLTEELMDYVTENQENLLGTIIEVKCNGLSSNSKGGNSVFYPALSKFRDDKDTANSFEECVEIQNAALGLTNLI